MNGTTFSSALRGATIWVVDAPNLTSVTPSIGELIHWASCIDNEDKLIPIRRTPDCYVLAQLIHLVLSPSSAYLSAENRVQYGYS